MIPEQGAQHSAGASGVLNPKRFAFILRWIPLLCLPVYAPFAAQDSDMARVERYSREAEAALAAKDPQTAIEALLKLSQLTPEVPEVHANLGLAYYMQAQFRQAAEAFQRAVKLNPSMPNTGLMLGICFAELGRYEEAIPLLKPAFRQPPNNQIGRLIGLELQRAYSTLQQEAEAVAVSEELVDRYPNDPEVLYHASRLHGDRALQLMFRLLSVAPESVWLKLARAEVHESQKHYDLAIREYERALEMDPRIPGVNYRLGRIFLLRSQDEAARDEALRAFQAELDIHPHTSAAWYEIGEIYRRRGQIQEAADCFSRAIEYHPKFEEAQIALGRTLLTLRRPEEALPHLLAAANLNSANGVTHYLLASAYNALGDKTSYEKEIKLYQKYHIRPYSSSVPDGTEDFGRLARDKVTRQTLDPGALSQD